MSEQCFAVIREHFDGEKMVEWVDFDTIRASEEGARLAFAAAEKYAGRTLSKDNPPVKIREFVLVKKTEVEKGEEK